MKKGKLADSMLQKKTESSEDIKQMSFSDWKMVTKTSINSK